MIDCHKLCQFIWLVYDSNVVRLCCWMSSPYFFSANVCFHSDSQIKVIYAETVTKIWDKRFSLKSDDNNLTSKPNCSRNQPLHKLPKSNIKKLRGDEFFRPEKCSDLVMESHGKIMEFYIKAMVQVMLLRLNLGQLLCAVTFCVCF